MLERKNRGEKQKKQGKTVHPNQGYIGAVREKVVNIAKNREKGDPNRYDQSSSHAIKPGKDRLFKTMCTLSLTSNESLNK